MHYVRSLWTKREIIPRRWS